jgi:hypothetical protein
MEGADIYQIAKNCRTSVEMIEKYYAAHIKTRLDAAAINVMRPQKFKTKTGNKARTKFQASPVTSDHNLQNLGNLAPRRETGNAEPLKSGTSRIGSQDWRDVSREDVETKWPAPKTRSGGDIQAAK